MQAIGVQTSETSQFLSTNSTGCKKRLARKRVNLGIASQGTERNGRNDF